MRKRIGTLLVGLLMAVGMAFAAQQQGQMGQMGKGKPTIDEQVARMKTNLNLTDQQTTQVKALLEKHQQEKETWRKNNPNPTQEQMKAHRKQMWNQMDQELKKILTPEQYKKHQEMMQQRMKHGPKGPPKK
jgi:Spy/CpxP family protein refolding chaperone